MQKRVTICDQCDKTISKKRHSLHFEVFSIIYYEENEYDEDGWKDLDFCNPQCLEKYMKRMWEEK